MSMKILFIHNHYSQRGGEGGVFLDEVDLLRKNGHQVVVYTRDNQEISEYSGVDNFGLILNTHWSSHSYWEIKRLLDIEQPDIVHFHNTFPLISPSAYYACKNSGVPVAQTIHNYRLICPSALLLRNNQICEECIGKTPPYPGIVHRCYRGSRVQTAIVASMLSFHRLFQTWRNQVNAYIALTDFSRRKLIEGGFPEDKMRLKPNFIPDPGFRSNYEDYIVFIGRLSEEKGVDTLLVALKDLPEIKLKIVGDGPQRQKIAQYLLDHDMNQIKLVGSLVHSEVLECVKKAQFLVLPSKWYEGFPRVLVEAMACGVPSVVSNIGSQQEIIINRYSGLHFEVNNPYHLAEIIAKLWNNPDLLERMGKNARIEYEKKYTPEENYNQLMDIYQFVLNTR